MRLQFKYYIKRFGHDENVELEWNERGWLIKSIQYQYNGQTDRIAGRLFDGMKHDLVSYPRDLESKVGDLWGYIHSGMSKKEAQKYLSDLSEWTILCEKNKP